MYVCIISVHRLILIALLALLDKLCRNCIAALYKLLIVLYCISLVALAMIL